MPGPATNPLGNARNIFILSVTVPAGAALTASTTTTRTYTVPGLDVGFDHVVVNKPTATAGVGIANARVSADDTLEISFGNYTAGTPSLPTTENYLVLVTRHDYPDRNTVPTGIA